MTEPILLSRSALEAGPVGQKLHRLTIGDQAIVHLAASSAGETLHAESMIRADGGDSRVVLFQLACCLREPDGSRTYPAPTDNAMDDLAAKLPGGWMTPLAHAIGAIAQGHDPQAAIDACLADDGADDEPDANPGE